MGCPTKKPTVAMAPAIEPETNMAALNFSGVTLRPLSETGVAPAAAALTHALALLNGTMLWTGVNGTLTLAVVGHYSPPS